jgi:hypothetical protein
LCVVDDGAGGLRVADDVIDLALRVRSVDGYDYEPEPLSGDKGDHEIDRCAGADEYPLAGTQPGGC